MTADREAVEAPALTLRAALEQTVAAIDDPARFTYTDSKYRAGWLDALRALRNDPALVSADRIIRAAMEAAATPSPDAGEPLERLRALSEKAASGPWRAELDNGQYVVTNTNAEGYGLHIAWCEDPWDMGREGIDFANFQFIAAVANYVRAALSQPKP